MSDHHDALLGGSPRRLRLATLVRLRWLAVAGQALAVAVVHFGLGFRLPVWGCAALITASVWLNIALKARYPANYRLSDSAATGLLAYDVLQLAALLFLTGGLENPFAFLFLAPVLISAMALPAIRTLYLGALVVAAATALALWHRPLPWDSGEPLDLPMLYVIGIWSSILLGVAFIATYAWRVAAEARDLAEALTATELVLAREQHLSQLDGLAAAAAHELGTPLATIALVAKEMARSAPEGSAMAEDVALLRQEVERCRSILGKLTSLEEEGGPLDSLSLRQLLEEVAGPQRPFGVPISVEVSGDRPEPVMRRNPAVLYGLGNLVDNAVDFAVTGVTLKASWTEARVTIEVADDGAGFPAEILLRAGDPYVTSRAPRGPRADQELRKGMGLGLFITKTLLERSGATIVFANAIRPETGARIRVSWPRSAFEARSEAARGGEEQGTGILLPHLPRLG
jgi:two-component system sensor histidine kinase RegB